MEIIKEFNEQYGFWTVKCPEGYVITTWKEGDAVENYTSLTIAYCPKDTDFDQFRCVTIEEDAERKEAARKAIENK